MESIPSPNGGNIAEARRYFQSNAPIGVSLSQVRRIRLRFDKYFWSTTWIAVPGFPSPENFEVDAIRRAFVGFPAKIMKISTEENFNGSILWVIDFDERKKNVTQHRQTVTIPDVLDEMPLQERLTSGCVRNEAYRVQIKREDSVTYVNVPDVLETDKIRKIFKGSKDVTRSICGKTRISSGLFRKFSPLLKRGYEVKNFRTSRLEKVKPLSVNKQHTVNNVPESRTHPGNDIRSNAESGVKVFYDYTDEKVQLARLGDDGVLVNVRDYLSALCIGFPSINPHPTQPLHTVGKLSTILLRVELSRKGLPDDEGLFKLYRNYMKSYGIKDPDIVRDLRLRHDQLKKF